MLREIHLSVCFPHLRLCRLICIADAPRILNIEWGVTNIEEEENIRDLLPFDCVIGSDVMYADNVVIVLQAYI